VTHIERTRLFLIATGMDRLPQLSAQGIVDQFCAGLPPHATIEDLPQEFKDAFKLVEKAFEVDGETMLQRITEIYALTFTEAEMIALFDFYSSPVGKKLVEFGGLIIPEARKFCDDWQLAIANKLPIGKMLGLAPSAEIPKEGVPTAQLANLFAQRPTPQP
jgi:hypothetical protein